MNTEVKDYLIGENRTWPRADTSFKAVFADDNGQFREDEVINISKGGLFVRTNYPRKMGERLELILLLPNEFNEITIQGQVMHSRAGRDPENPDLSDGMGIMFTTIEPSQKKSFSHFINHLLLEQMTEKRLEDRIETPLNRIILNASETKYSALLCNLSASGVLVRTHDPLVLFEQVQIQLNHPDNGLDLDVRGEVVHVSKTPEKTHTYSTGIKFVGLDPHSQAAIHDLVREIMLRQKMVGLSHHN